MYVQIRNRFWEFCRTKFPEKNQDQVKVFYFLLGVIKEEEKGGDTSSIYHI